ncbi:Amine sulfotransferase [Sarcoptes scabiei]|uniref:Amine sulfotransferase n=1 Tax=Sarcoptes scabiei TaxID=52283 RepID=A0A834VFR3_SARSC|nr:Amine sulfotransferase [Sarcoptes scabiei]
MKNIKNSLKKLSKNSSSDQNSHKTENVSAENSSIAVKRQNYKNLTPNSISYKGYDFPDDIVNRRVLENLQDLEIRDDDVFLITYPANGAHLLEDVVQNLLNESMQKIHQQQKIERERQNGSMIIESETTSETKLLSSNLPFDLLPKQTQSQLSSSSTKIIYQCRNCKDHLVSYYYHHRLKGISIPLNDFIDLYLDGYLFYGDYFDHVLSFWQLSKLYPRNVLFICYEELQIMTHNMASIIAKFLNLNLSDEEINESIRKLSKPNPIIN